MKRWIPLLCMVMMPLGAMAKDTADHQGTAPNEKLVQIAFDILDGKTSAYDDLAFEEKEALVAILDRIVDDPKALTAISDELIGFEYIEDDDRPDINGQYYPTQWKFPFCGSWQISCGYDCWVNYWDDKTKQWKCCINTHSGSDDYALDWSLPGETDNGQPVFAPADGWVLWTGLSGGYGICAIIDHGNNVFSRLAHLRDDGVLIRQTKYVRQGDTIGTCGNTGNASGSHIHFAVLENARWGGGSTIYGAPIKQNGISGHWDLRVDSYYDSYQVCQSR